MTYDRADGFRNLLVGVNEAADANNLSDLERKHLPLLESPETVRKGELFEVRVTAGGLLSHPNEYKHFIQAIELYAGETFLARVDLTAVRTCPEATFRVSLQHPAEELCAYARCNLHGVWVGRKPIAVTDSAVPSPE